MRQPLTVALAVATTATFVRLVAEHDALATYLLGDVSKWLDRAETRLQRMGRSSATNRC